MTIASPAPQVEPAVATSAPIEDPAIAEQAILFSGSVQVDPAQKVDPAVAIDDPMKYAPDNVNRDKTTKNHHTSLSAAKLRETNHNNHDFECNVAVINEKPQKNILRRLLPWIFDERDFVAYGEVLKYIYVKDKCTCFIYNDMHDPIPLYAIDLLDYFAVLEDPNHLDPQSYTVSPVPNSNKSRPELITVLLKRKTTKEQSYQFTFDTTNQPNVAKEFYDLVTATLTCIAKDTGNVKKKPLDDGNGTKVGAFAVDSESSPPKKAKKDESAR